MNPIQALYIPEDFPGRNASLVWRVHGL